MTQTNDTHGVAGKGWHGFDLDGTLAVYDKWEGIDHIGEPIAPMVDLIRKMHESGEVVKILTARVSPRPEPEYMPTPHPMYADSYPGANDGDVPEYAAKAEFGSGPERQLALAFYAKREWNARDFVADWCLKNLGFLPEITHEKDHLMLDLYDDRVKQVVPNKGLLVEDLGPKVEVHPIEIRNRHLDFFDWAAMTVGKVFIWASVTWGLVLGIPMLVMKLVK